MNDALKKLMDEKKSNYQSFTEAIDEVIIYGRYSDEEQKPIPFRQLTHIVNEHFGKTFSHTAIQNRYAWLKQRKRDQDVKKGAKNSDMA